MCHVLIIEDEWLITQYLIDLAEEAGGTSIATARTEHEAVQAARARTPSIILSDVHLLIGTGPSAVQSILGELGEISVIFITATPHDCRPRPGAIILTKPINPARLIDTFKRLTT